MSDVPSVDLYIRQGNSRSFVFRFKAYDGDDLVAVDLTGSTIVFTAEATDTPIERSTADSTLDMNATAGEVTLAFTPTQTRLHTVGRTNRFSVERWVSGEETTLLQGYLVVSEGTNVDDD